eukprot:jgi/Bigna1/63314/fgenesh1_kg.50_\
MRRFMDNRKSKRSVIRHKLTILCASKPEMFQFGLEEYTRCSGHRECGILHSPKFEILNLQSEGTVDKKTGSRLTMPLVLLLSGATILVFPSFI